MINLKENVHVQIKAYCAKKKIKLIDFCKISGIDKNYLANWREGNPKAIEMLSKMIDAMQDIENDNQDAAV
jgi:transcriptional regulator with XRE-family HTH domain